MKKNILYIDILRIFACFLVIVNHTCSTVLNFSGKGYGAFYCAAFSISKIAVPVFIMISGILILEKSYSFKKVLMSIIRVAVPTVAVILFLQIYNNGFKSFNFTAFLKDNLNAPSAAHFWYVYMLIGLYIATPFIQKMVKDFTGRDYILFTVFFLMIPTFLTFLKVCTGISTSSFFTLAVFPTVIGYYVAGKGVSKLPRRVLLLILCFVIFTVSLAMQFFSMFSPYHKGLGISYNLDTWASFPVVLMSLSVVYIFKFIFAKEKSGKINRFIKTVASTTFGIYLIHTLINYRLFDTFVFQKIFGFNAVIGSVVLEACVFAICFLIIFILKKIPFVKKFL